MFKMIFDIVHNFLIFFIIFMILSFRPAGLRSSRLSGQPAGYNIDKDIDLGYNIDIDIGYKIDIYIYIYRL